ncbi:hypothetical protein [Streptomyces tsukubensis]|uniref:Uncharacterized protein n=1 Tax=Streptomyces tsukubensis TaxID=83656 RepID=A0A1V4A817_9ACTN|nr:hypothetical protein [Streptomyces tsukubensis]OON78826.1 hypothetical protein B1H18_15785 [Streptomyces tsukubensis]QFR94301.1 hypothetical protein GBW32_16110 [Streptomyces tsukubensis]
MAINEDLRKTLTDPTPLYFAAGTADLAVQQALKVPGLIEQLRAEAPARFEAVRRTDPKDVQDRATARAKEAQAVVQSKANEVFSSFDTDLKKLGESAQGFALRGVGIAAEYAVKARETYEKVAERGERTVKTWRGEAAEEIVDFAGVVEPEPVRVVEEPAADKPAAVAVAEEPNAAKSAAAEPKAAAPAKKPAAKKTGTGTGTGTGASAKKAAPNSTAAKKTTPPAGE